MGSHTRLRRQATRAAAYVGGIAVGAILTFGAGAQSSTETRITGTISGVTSNGSTGQGAYQCTGEPTCAGTYYMSIREPDCSNSYEFGGRFRMTGADLSRTGYLTVLVSLEGFGVQHTRNVDGTCHFTGGGDTENAPMSGTWDGTTATLRGEYDDTNASNQPIHIVVTSTFTATRPAPPTPVFPMTVTANITPTVANAEARIEFRPQDVGTQASVFVFAVAPADRVRGGLLAKDAALAGKSTARRKEDAPVQCVLAQLAGNGQLTAVSVSTIQAALSGVLSATGQSVQILNNVATPNVAGATFFVGYGASASAMINNGVNRSAVTVPGERVCQPQPPQTGWWWNPAEDGRGFSLEVRGNNLFFASFLYDVTGRSTWYVATGPASLDGSYFSGPLYSARGGQTLGGAYGGAPTLAEAGTLTLAFNNDRQGTLVWPGGTIPIQRFDIVAGGSGQPAAQDQPENGWWWNPQESGRGFFMEWQGNTLDLAGYMYDDQGNSVWYLAWAGMPANSMSFNGTWWSFANGQTLTGAWKPNTRVNDNVAPVTIQFTSRSTAVMTLPNGRTTQLQRHRF